MWPFNKAKPEARAAVTQSREEFWSGLMGTGALVVAGKPVTTDAALGLPAVWAAVNFLSGTLAGLPLHVYRTTETGREKETGPLAMVLGRAPNDDVSSFEWRKSMFEAVLTTGRAFTYIERNNAGRVVNLWPLEPSRVTVRRTDRGRVYQYRQPSGGSVEYASREVIDVPYMLKPDQCGHYGPIHTCREAIGLALAAQRYGEKSFQSGGVPAVTLKGPFNSAESARRASDDIAKVMQAGERDGKPVVALPTGHELAPLGFKPQDMQSIEFQRFCIEQAARVYQLPPIFLQDLTHGTFSNTEQQDLHFVKHTVKRWVEQVEQEMNLKLFGRTAGQFVEFNVNGLLRGDVKTRMEAHAAAIQNGIYTPAFAAGLENYPYHEEADQVFIQGGTMPIEQNGQEDGADDA